MSEKSQVPEVYKKTELGIIPEEWEVEELGNICNFFDHLRVPIKKADRVKRFGIYPYYGAQSIIDWINDYIFDGTYLLIAEDGENLKSKVLPIAYQVSGKFWVNNHAHIIQPKDNHKIGYLEYILNFIDIERYITGSAQPKLNQNTAKKIKIQLPSPDEQQKIASILSKIDEQIEQTEQIIEKTETLKKGLMQKLLTKGIGHTKFKKTELGEIPEEWEIGLLDNISEINPRSNVSYLNENSNVTFLPMQNIGENGRILKYETRKYGEVKKGYTCFSDDDILFAKITPCMENGKGALATNLENKIGFGSTEYHVLRAKQNGNPHFIFYITKWEKFRKEAEKYMTGSAGQRRVSKNIFSSYKIPIPPVFEQQKIAFILSKVDSQIQDNQNYLTRLQELKKGLMQDLLTGKVRVCV